MSYNKEIEDVFLEFKTSPEGLSPDEAEKRLLEVGPNILDAEERINPVKVILHQFADPLIYILLVAAVFTAIIRHFIDTWVILAVVVINAIIGFTQEWRAEQAIRSLQALAAPQSHVLRAGKRLEIESSMLVPGDIVSLESGTRVPADLRLFEVKRLDIDESTLTGESISVHKNTQVIRDEGISLADRRNMAFMGTLVLSGRGRGIVVGTGRATELGQISDQVRHVKPAPTPLQAQLGKFSRWLGLVILLISVASVALGLALGRRLFDMILTGTALAVGAIPEGLPVVVTITLSIGVKRMARRNAIVRRLPAVETLGSTTVIASDKTGTLTKNEMTVQMAWAGGATYRFSGVGFEPAGEILDERDEPVNLKNHRALEKCLRVGLLTNDSRLGFAEERGYYPDGDPTEVALIVAAQKAGLRLENQALIYPTLDEIPFESDLMYMATLHKSPLEDGNLIFVKGAPEKVTARCDCILDHTGDKESPFGDRETVYSQARAFSREGLRVLAMAYRRVPAEVTTLNDELMKNGFTLLGLQGMIDPPREEVFTAITQAKKAGVRVIMVTGDNRETAVAIGRRLALVEGENIAVLTGSELEEISDHELFNRVREVNVYARATPLHKLRIVQQLIKNGEVVAVTGDGVNDTPALKASHIGVAMGKGGTDAAKETSDMIVTDDNFASIFDAVKEGRVVFSNIRKVILFLLSTGLAQIILIFISLALGMPLPLLPAQILWLNLVSNGLQDVALAFEPGAKGIIELPPRKREEPVLTSLMLQRLVLIGIVIAVGTTYTFTRALEQGYALDHARTVALTTIVLFQLFNVFNVRSETLSIFRMALLSNPFLFFSVIASIAAQVAIVYVPAFQMIFRTAPLNIYDWVFVVLMAIVVLAAVEVEKAFRTRFARL
ncbi:MAG: HAD-IC family P-type ATPase [Bacillota bacterium]